MVQAAGADEPAPAGRPPADQPAGGFKPTDLAALLVASLAIGIAVSAIMTDVGTAPWVVMAAATFAYSGTGELAYASVISSGGTMVPALVAALLVSSRFGLLAMSMANRWPASRLERVGIAHVASEPAVAAAIEAGGAGPRAARRAFWQLAFWLALGWVIGSGLGLLLGDVVGDTKRIGLDAVFPASFVGAVVISFRRLDTAAAALGGGVAAVALTPFLPAGAPILVAALAAPLALLLPPRPLGRTARAAALASAAVATEVGEGGSGPGEPSEPGRPPPDARRPEDRPPDDRSSGDPAAGGETDPTAGGGR
jgi:predicted branched-subunit amino acid permease